MHTTVLEESCVQQDQPPQQPAVRSSYGSHHVNHLSNQNPLGNYYLEHFENWPDFGFEPIQLGSSSVDDLFSGLPTTQPGDRIYDSGVTVNDFKLAPENNIFGDSLFHSSFADIEFPQDSTTGDSSQMGLDLNSSGFLNQFESPSAIRNSPVYHSLDSASHNSSPQNIVLSSNSQGRILTDQSPQESVSPPHSNSSKTGNPSSRIEKRTRNTLAARRYRQKRVDQVDTLEASLKETESERDALKVRVARLEGELEALKSLMKSK